MGAPGTDAHDEYVAGAAAFSTAGQFGSIFNLVLSFVFMGLGFTSLPSNLIYSPCLILSAVVCFGCAFVVGHSHLLATICFIISNVGLTAAGSIPFGIVAVWNKMAEERGQVGSVAMQMAILNCCITVGQQLCTMILGGFEGAVDVVTAVKYLYIISMVANSLGGIGSLMLTVDKKGGKTVSTESSTEGSESDCTSSD